MPILPYEPPEDQSGMVPERLQQREPLLSDKQMGATTGDSWGWDCAVEVRDFYEDLITEGRLRVVATVPKGFLVRDEYVGCANKECRCPHSKHYNFCPGCGAKIVEA